MSPWDPGKSRNKQNLEFRLCPVKGVKKCGKKCRNSALNNWIEGRVRIEFQENPMFSGLDYSD